MPRRWGFPSLLQAGLAREFPTGSPDAAPTPLSSLRVVDSSGQLDGAAGVPAAQDAGGRRPLSWDAEDAAIAAGECPWCDPSPDFEDVKTWVRHVVMHARGWEAEMIHTERLRRDLREQVARFTADVVDRANGLGRR